jgi:hypothetical protein
VAGRVGRESARVRLAEVDIAFIAEENVPAADVFVLIGSVRRVPVVARELVVGAR